MADLRASPEQSATGDLRHVAGRRWSFARYLLWGSIAVCAVLGSALTIALVVSAHRTGAFTQTAKAPAPAAPRAQQQTGPATTSPAPAPQADANAAAPAPVRAQSIEHEVGRLQEALRSLSAERDRLASRVEQLEQIVGDITASIGSLTRPEVVLDTPTGRSLAARAAAAIAERRAAIHLSTPAAAEAANAPPDITASIPAPRRPAPPTPLRTSGDRAVGVTATEFAVDLGAESNMNAVRLRWGILRRDHGAVLDNLQPLVSVREGSRRGTDEYRLLAGPFTNAAAAARTCAALEASGIQCRTTAFEGQRLTQR